MKSILNLFFKKPKEKPKTFGIFDFFDREERYEELKTQQMIKDNLLPPNAYRQWTDRYSVEGVEDFLQRTKWTKCYNCQNWYIRQVVCRNCGESNRIYPNCPHCQATLRELPPDWDKCQTCRNQLNLEDTTKKC